MKKSSLASYTARRWYANLSAGAAQLKASNLTLTARRELQAAPRYFSQTGTPRLKQLF